jgi:uncharacterized membrane protein YuzA (DUF378 family)
MQLDDIFSTPSIRRLKEMPYQQYLLTSHWKSLKERCRKRDENRCQQCGSSESLNVHHWSYKNRGDSKREIDDLELLCKDCHEEVHGIRADKKNSNKTSITNSIFWNLIDKLLGGIFNFVFDLIEKLLGNSFRFTLGLILIIVLSGALSNLNSKQVNKTQVSLVNESQTEIASVNKNLIPIADKTNTNIISKKPRIPTKIVVLRGK